MASPFDPGRPAGFEIEQVDGVWTGSGDLAQDYRSVPEESVPAMRDAGFSEELITKLMHGNPWNAFSRQPPVRLSLASERHTPTRHAVRARMPQDA